MIRQEVGNDSLFFDILKTFLEVHKFGNATGIDFKNHVEQKTGKDFNAFFNQWYFGEGYPVQRIVWEHRNDTLYINSAQTVTSTTPLFNVLLEFKVTANNRDTIISFRQTATENEWQAYIPGEISSVKADPNHWLLIDLSDFSGLKPVEIDSGLSIKPNPAKNSVKITMAQSPGKYRLQVINGNGEVMKSFESSAAENELDIQHFSSGMYFIIIKNNKTTLHGKFIVN
jgi:hypothetical protein